MTFKRDSYLLSPEARNKINLSPGKEGLNDLQTGKEEMETLRINNINIVDRYINPKRMSPIVLKLPENQEKAFPLPRTDLLIIQRFLEQQYAKSKRADFLKMFETPSEEAYESPDAHLDNFYLRLRKLESIPLASEIMNFKASQWQVEAVALKYLETGSLDKNTLPSGLSAAVCKLLESFTTNVANNASIRALRKLVCEQAGVTPCQ